MTRFAPALALAAALGCASAPPAARKPAGPVHKTFHYKTSASELGFGRLWHTTIDVNSDTRWADAVHLKIPSSAVLRVKTQLARQVPVNVLIYAASSGKKPLIVDRAPSVLETPPLEGDVWVVVRVGETTGQIVVKLIAELPGVAGAMQGPAPPPAAAAAPAPPAEPSLSSIPDLEFDEHAPE